MRSLTDARRWVYCLPKYTTNEIDTTEENDSTSWDSPSPSSFSSSVELEPESLVGQRERVSQHLFNTTSTLIQQPPIVEFNKNGHNQDTEIDSKPKQFIQHITKEEGERGGVEQEQFNDVLQIKQSVHSPITSRDTASQSNSQVHTSQQKAFQQKYQPVEVLNRDGEWVSGYWVHKCIVVGNLEGIERKWALVDEMGAKYVFLGQIRVPRFG